MGERERERKKKTTSALEKKKRNGDTLFEMDSLKEGAV
jgi:hypothetical protein